MTRCSDFQGEDAEETKLGRELIVEARSFLTGFEWCDSVRDCYVSDAGIGGVVAVVLFRIHPGLPDVDEWLWVVVGDVPPAYLVTDDAPDAVSALGAYVNEMDAWVSSVRRGASVDDLIPVTTREGGTPVDPTTENADDLGSRLTFLRAELLAD